jgi:hypothetical protein
VRGETALGAEMALTRFNVDFTTAEVLLNAVPIPAPPPPAVRPNSTDTGGTITVVPVFIAGNSTISPTSTATVTVEGEATPRTSTGIAQQVPVVDAHNNTIGFWVSFQFPGTITSNATTDSKNNKTTTTVSTDGRTATVGSGVGSVNLTITVRDDAMHTIATVNKVYTIPTYAVMLTAVPPYRALVSVQLGSGSRITNLRVIAYTDRDLSVRAYPTKSDNVSCAYDAANFSTTCTTAVLGEPVRIRKQAADLYLWEFELYAEPPTYFTGELAVRVHLRADDAPWKEIVLRLTSSAPAPGSSVLIAAPNPSGGAPVPVSPPAGSTPSTDPVSTSDAPAAPQVIDVTTTIAPSFKQAVVNGIFSMSGSGCNSAPVNFLAATIIVYIVAMVIRALVSLVRTRRTRNPRDAIRTYDTPMSRSLLVNHIYVGFIVPCHHYCGPVHTTLMFVHIMCFFAFASVVYNLFPQIPDTFGGAVTLGIAVVLMTAAVQPIFNAVFMMYKIIDRRTYLGGRDGDYSPQDLAGFGIERRDHVGVSAKTVKTLDMLDFDEPTDTDGLPASRVKVAPSLGSTLDDHHQPNSRAVAPPSLDSTLEDHPAGRAQLSPNSTFANDTFVGNDTFASDAACDVVAAGESMTPSTDAQTYFSPPRMLTAASGSSTHAPLSPVLSANNLSFCNAEEDVRRQNVACLGRDPRDCVEVDARKFTIAGYAGSLLTCIALALIVADNIKSWCDSEYSAFWHIIAVAVVSDLVVIQPLCVALTYAWRWLVHDAGEDEGFDEEDESMVGKHIIHELHPIHGQWRYEGALMSQFDFHVDSPTALSHQKSDI